MMESQNDLFLFRYRAEIRKVQESYDPKPKYDVYLESALCFLLERYADELPPIESERFHKSFRQSDVVDSDAPSGLVGTMDMAIWNLLSSNCVLFWELQGKWAKSVKLAESEGEATA